MTGMTDESAERPLEHLLVVVLLVEAGNHDIPRIPDEPDRSDPAEQGRVWSMGLNHPGDGRERPGPDQVARAECGHRRAEARDRILAVPLIQADEIAEQQSRPIAARPRVGSKEVVTAAQRSETGAQERVSRDLRRWLGQCAHHLSEAIEGAMRLDRALKEEWRDREPLLRAT